MNSSITAASSGALSLLDEVTRILDHDLLSGRETAAQRSSSVADSMVMIPVDVEERDR
jgi:hypothetical protein